MKHCLLALFILNSYLIKAQSSKDSVINVVNNLFDAMRNADAKQLKACFTDSAILQTIVPSAPGTVKVRTDRVDDFAEFLSNEARGNADERIQLEAIHIDGALASVWTPYAFYYKGKFSHCGVNSLQLVRLGSGWKIQYLIDTRRKEGCSGN
ncbi:nuclear transport factor 2 family protein [Niabella hibiscisoli]|uniref:nuclear transport factor 2 family protein n=1 Tax=Niabella hibiscisoli TaxID=1825928 RepID=UPI001F0FF60A|nr:nuclear transport factor 2 family protein [Niabella hibiscisoli]MCH5720649.1 nuclear transport factor 2 family protein [Niabella hibiscisoli]